jgi:hypothetical protein
MSRHSAPMPAKHMPTQTRILVEEEAELLLYNKKQLWTPMPLPMSLQMPLPLMFPLLSRIEIKN